MKSKNHAFENSLVCLQHPLTLLSIVVLLLNDHVLKVVSPSWLTGKLSDFAGLFFFPFIVAAGLGVLVSKFNLETSVLGKIAFGTVALWFILLKTFPPVNSTTAQIAALTIGSPAHFIMDSTDLIGLTAMFPAWKLWNQRKQWQQSKLAYFALSIGAFAVIATSPKEVEWSIRSVTNLEHYSDGIVYAADKNAGSENSYSIAQSTDGGVTWEFYRVGSIEEKSLPIKHCSHLDTDICYQVTKSGWFEESRDGGRSWQKVPLASNLFTYDLILFEWEGKEYVIVALGNHGILRRKLPDGDWEMIGVLDAADR